MKHVKGYGLTTFLFVVAFGAIGVLIAQKAMKLDAVAAERHSESVWGRVDLLTTSLHKYYMETCRVGVVSVSDLQSSRVLNADFDASGIVDLTLRVRKPSVAAYTEVAFDVYQGDKAFIKDLLAHGASIEDGVIKYRKLISDTRSAVQRRISLDHEYFGSHHC